MNQTAGRCRGNGPLAARCRRGRKPSSTARLHSRSCTHPQQTIPSAHRCECCECSVDARQWQRMHADRSLRGKVDNGGFTLIEVMVALLLLLIGVAGVLSLQMVSVKATGFSRHATEATILAEDKMEELMTISPALLDCATVADCTDTVDSDGVDSATGFYVRTWVVALQGVMIRVTVTVNWNERGSEPHAITVATLRRP